MFLSFIIFRLCCIYKKILYNILVWWFNMKKVIFLLFIFVLLTGCSKDRDKIIDDIDTNLENNIVENDNNQNEDINKEEQITENSYVTEDNKINNNSNSELVNTSNIKSEEDVVNYFVELKDKIKEKLNKDTWENVKESIVNALNIAYGFCFKGEEIGGYTLNELSDNAKEKILNIVFDIDEFIESKSPGYKESFKENYDNFIESSKSSLEIIKDKITDIFKKEEE